MSEEASGSRIRLPWTPIAFAVLVGSCVAVLLGYVVFRVRGVFFPFLVGFFIAYALNPILHRLEARGWSRRKAVWVVTALFFLVVGVLVTVVVVVVVVQTPRAVADVGAWGNDQIRLFQERKDPLHQFLQRELRTRFPGHEQAAMDTADSYINEAINALDRKSTRLNSSH